MPAAASRLGSFVRVSAITQCTMPPGFNLASPRALEMILQFGGWRGSCGAKVEGDEGWASVADGYGKPDVSDKALLGEYQKVMSEYQAKAQRPLDHMQDFLASVRSRRQTAFVASSMSDLTREKRSPG